MPINIFTTIDDPLATGDITLAADINESGQIVGLFESADFSAHGFVLSSGSFSMLPRTPAGPRP
jgi:probable HAF family extracellular repeat protein